MEQARRAAKCTQSREEWWRWEGGQPNTLRAGRSDGGGQEGSQMHSEPGGVSESRRAAKYTPSRQAHSEPGGEVEGSARAAKLTQSRREWWREREGC